MPSLSSVVSEISFSMLASDTMLQCNFQWVNVSVLGRLVTFIFKNGSIIDLYTNC